MKKPYKTAFSTSNRSAALAKIHIAKQQLSLDDDTYRALLHNVAGVTSSTQLDQEGFDRVLAYFKKSGVQFKSNPKKTGRVPNTLANREQLQKIHALLTTQNKPFEYAVGIAKRMYKKEALEFCTPQELRGVIAALVRVGEKKSV
ncbi:MAG: regulatory protein GemA [Methylococcales bacterium]|nr:regulatory protein GemA [Methylococcales bacterium]